MDNRDTAGIASFDDVMDRVQDALRAVGSLERSIGDLGDEKVRNTTRNELSTATSALQNVRDRVAQSIG